MHAAKLISGVLVAGSLAACSISPDPESLNFDPYEPANRVSHDINKQVDLSVYGPVSRSYGTAVPEVVRTGITNVKQNWSHPVYVLHYAVQGQGEVAARTFMRFGINTIFGFAGLLDWAGEMGLENRETDFDETFRSLGIAEGGYVELPFGGPGTERDWTGWALDFTLDPVSLVTGPAASTALLVVSGLDLINDRYELDTVVDELYHQSADSYNTTRITYLQRKRAGYEGQVELESLEDIYADF